MESPSFLDDVKQIQRKLEILKRAKIANKL